MQQTRPTHVSPSTLSTVVDLLRNRVMRGSIARVNSAPSAGWYQHPEDPASMRYWDGSAWTGHIAPTGSVPQAAPIFVAVGVDDGRSRKSFPTTAIIATAVAVTVILVGGAITSVVLFRGDSGEASPASAVESVPAAVESDVPAPVESDIPTAAQSESGLWGVSDAEACKVAAEEAVRISGDRNQAVSLIKVHQPRMVKDNRNTVEIPSGAGSALVLSCRGTGIWSSGETDTTVTLRVLVDSDNTYFVGYETKW